MTPNPDAIRAFKSERAFEAWLKINHARKSEVFIRIHKKVSNVATVTYAQALDVALCWGWIDGIRKSYDELSFLQRFTPRGPKSRWSQINRAHVARLTAEGRMNPAGQRHIDAAKADGRWRAAYASPSKIEVPSDLLAAINGSPKARATFRGLNRQNVYALAYRTIHLKTSAVRQRRIQEYVAMLARGESIYPNGARGNVAEGRGARAPAGKTQTERSTKSAAKASTPRNRSRVKRILAPITTEMAS